jgi:hypothetical protein
VTSLFVCVLRLLVDMTSDATSERELLRCELTEKSFDLHSNEVDRYFTYMRYIVVKVTIGAIRIFLVGGRRGCRP